MNDLTVFSINALAIDISSEYYLKKYPSECKNGLLVFSVENGFDRGNFGFVAVARIAALLPYIVKIYLEYATEFSPKTQQHIDLYINSESIKVLQVISLMYASGRWHKSGTNPTIDPNLVYIEQNIAECRKKLEVLGITTIEANNYALLLKQNDYLPPESYKLYYAILQDTITIVNTIEKPSEIVEKLQFNMFFSNHVNVEVKNKFVSILQGLNIAKIRQQGIIAESETAFHPITLSYKRILGSLFHDFDLTFAALEKKNMPLIVTTDATTIKTDNLVPSIQDLLLKYPNFSAIQSAVDSFVHNTDKIQIEFGDKKQEYANNLWQAWEQTWSRIYHSAVARFETFKNDSKNNCKTEQEYFAAIEKRIVEIGNVGNDELTDDELILAIQWELLAKEAKKIKISLENNKISTSKPKPASVILPSTISDKQSEVDVINDYNINTEICLNESIISFQQYLIVRQKQIAEFSIMADWYRKKKIEIINSLNMEGLKGAAKQEKLEKSLHVEFIKHNMSNDTETKFFAYNIYSEKYQYLQLYTLMELFDGIQMNIQEDGFVLDINYNNKIVHLVYGKIKSDKLEMSCNNKILRDRKLNDRALLLIIDQRKHLLKRNVKQQDNSFTIMGKVAPELLIKLYQAALLQNLNPIIG